MSPKLSPRIAAMAAYVLPELKVAAGVRLRSLAQNESALPPSPAALQAATSAVTRAALYPDPDWWALRDAIANVHGLDAGSILCGSGSMDLIAALASAYLDAGDRALTTRHGYLFFRTAARLAGAEVDLAPEPELTVDVSALLRAVTPHTRVVFVANPGNPTGTHITREALLTLRAGLPDEVLLIIDEAYGEFADEPGERVFDLVAGGDTVVLRTFSKAYGLTGMRVGRGVFPPGVAREVRKIQLPGSVGLPVRLQRPPRCRIRPSWARPCRPLASVGTASPPGRGRWVFRSPSAAPASCCWASRTHRQPGLPMRRCGPKVYSCVPWTVTGSLTACVPPSVAKRT